MLTMVLVSLIPLGGLWYISLFKAEQEAISAVFLNIKNSADALAEKVDSWYDTNLLIIEQNSRVPAIRSMVAGQQNPILATISESYKWVYLAFTVLPDGQSEGRSDGNPSQFYGDRDYFQQVMKGQMVSHEVVIGKTSGKPALILSVPVYGIDNDKKGVLAFAMTLEDLSKNVTNVSVGDSGNAILLDQKNRVVAKNRELLSSLEDLSIHPAIMNAEKGTSLPAVVVENGQKVITWAKTTKSGWKVIVQQNYEEAFSFISQTRRQALILLVITLSVTTVVAFFLSAGLAGPIKRLTQISDSMSRGELGLEINETQRRDEIGDLARSIERMGISLQMAFERMKKK